MKKFFLLTLIFLAALCISARGLYDNDVVVTGKTIYYCTKVTFSMMHARCILHDGSVVKLNMHDINAFQKNSCTYEKVPIYRNNKPTSQVYFMQLISTRDDMKLYRYDRSDLYFEHPSKEKPSVCSGNVYYVFKNGKYVMELCENNFITVMNFFGINI